MANTQPRIIVCGTGYWGINHVRNFQELGHLLGIVDNDAPRAHDVAQRFAVNKVYSSLALCLEQADVDAVVIATPAASHYDFAKMALLAGKDVLVEKPLALKLEQAKELVALAQQQQRVLMVGHLLQYHPCTLALKALVEQDVLGPIEYVYSNRLNLGKIRSEENILWSFAPHDISLMLWLTQHSPIQVNVVGGNYLQPNIPDTTISTFLFDQGIRGHIYVSWLHPFKEQRLVLVGRKKMAVFNDQAGADSKLMLYDKQVSQVDGQFITQKPVGTPVPYDHSLEPLKEECRHFIDCVRSRQTPRTDGHEGLRVLNVLHHCQRSLEMSGQPVQVLPF